MTNPDPKRVEVVPRAWAIMDGKDPDALDDDDACAIKNWQCYVPEARPQVAPEPPTNQR